MQCPHCLMHFHEEWKYSSLGANADGNWSIECTYCAACKKLIVRLECSSWSTENRLTVNKFIVYPKASGRSPVSDDVPREFIADYEEAALILADSPKASAALSRRCLQHILREAAGVREKTLYADIQKVIDSNALPSYLSEPLDMLRKIGNVAAHATQNANTGEIVPVDPNEAAWCLDVIELLFDFYFVGPANAERQQQAFQEKLRGTDDSLKSTP